MQIRRVAIIAAIDAALTKHDKDVNEYQRQVAKWKADRRAAWDRESTARWKALRDLITARLRAGKPITPSDLKGALGSESAVNRCFADREPSASEIVVPRCPVEKLKSFRAALVAIADDAVTPSALKALGYKELEWVFTAAIKNGGAVR